MTDDIQAKVQQQVSDNLNDLLERAINERKQHHVDKPNKIPQPEGVDGIISSCANTNALVAGAVGLVPGPWGMLAAVPEIMAVMRNQTHMIVDIGVAYGQHRYMRPDLIAGIMMSGFGSGAGSLVAVRGGQLLVKRASLRVMQKLIVALGGRVTQQVLKTMIGKWLPIVGAAAMAAWARYSTKQLGLRASEMLSKQIVDAGEADDDDAPSASWTTPGETAPGRHAVERAAVQVLINLMLADQRRAPEEVDYIGGLIAGLDVPESERESLRALLAAGKQAEADYSVLAASPEHSTGLLFSMVALAARDGQVHPAERMFVKQAAQRLGFTAQDVDDAFGELGKGEAAERPPVDVEWAASGEVIDKPSGLEVGAYVSGRVSIAGIWPEAEEWVGAQALQLAGRALSGAEEGLLKARGRTEALAEEIGRGLEALVARHGMRVLGVSDVDVSIAPEGMEALRRSRPAVPKQ